MRRHVSGVWPECGAEEVFGLTGLVRFFWGVTPRRSGGLKAIFIIMSVEQPQLLSAMNRIERVVNVERNPFGYLLERLAIKIDHGATHAQQGAGVGQVFQPRDRRLRTQFAIGGRQIERHLEHGIAAKTGGIIAVFVSRRNHQQSKADDVGEAVRDLIGRARVNDAGSHAIGDTKALLDLAQNQYAPSDDNRPPSNLATTVLLETGDRPGSGSIGSFMAGVDSLKRR